MQKVEYVKELMYFMFMMFLFICIYPLSLLWLLSLMRVVEGWQWWNPRRPWWRMEGLMKQGQGRFTSTTPASYMPRSYTPSNQLWHATPEIHTYSIQVVKPTKTHCLMLCVYVGGGGGSCLGEILGKWAQGLFCEHKISCVFLYFYEYLIIFIHDICYSLPPRWHYMVGGDFHIH